MFVRRSVRLNPACTANVSPNKDNNGRDCFVPDSQNQEQKDEPSKEFFNNPTNSEEGEKIKNEEEAKTVHDVEMDDVKAPKDVSATVKALDKIGSDKRRPRRATKLPVAVRRKLLNKKLARLLTPKSALILLHELKPNCVYKVQEQPGCIPPSFFAQVLFNDEVLGTGQGLSKSHAKNSAAENAIKNIVSKTMTNQSEEPDMKGNIVDLIDEEMEDTPENLPWAGLASFAIYKMFSEWQSQGADLLTRTATKPKTKPPGVTNATLKKDLPPNAHELHPAVVLNMVCPGLVAVEVEREDGPKCRVKMEYSVNGRTFAGVGARAYHGGNKKDAKKEAAKALLQGIYGLTYPQ